MKWALIAAALAVGGIGIACFSSPRAHGSAFREKSLKPPHSLTSHSGAAAKIVSAAHVEANERATYTTGYFRLAYPNGDLPRNQGVCTDVVIRALRGAGYDLQLLLHEDVVRHFKAYPRREAHPDSNIDHRRVPNQMFFFGRFGKTLTKSTASGHRAEWHPGDIVYWKLPSGLDHAGVLSDRIGPSGLPMVIHNLEVCREEDVLAAWTIQGHYRYPVVPGSILTLKSTITLQ